MLTDFSRVNGVVEIIIRFLIGGAVVSVFSLVGGLFKPISFAGLFGRRHRWLLQRWA